MKRLHKWNTTDCCEWVCDYCRYAVIALGPPSEDFKIEYKIDGSKKKYNVSCEEIERGIIEIFKVHES